jgi:GNAT superfamily N-acetyltransferase
MSAESKVHSDSHRKGGTRPAAKMAATRHMDPPPLPLNRRFGGHETTIRLLEPGDCDTLLKFFESHTRETIHLRYGYELSQISEARAAELVGVDQTKDAALGIFERGQAVPLVAIGRYCLKTGGGSAEVAFVVREDRRHLGMATALLKILLGMAAARGLKNLDAQVLRENQPMLEIFGKLGGTKAGIPGTDSVVVSIDVARALRRHPK